MLKLEIMLEFYFVVLTEKMLKEDKFYVNQEALHHIRNLKLAFMFFLKKKVDVILHSLVTIDLNSTSEQLMLLV